MIFVYARHGQTSTNKLGIFQGQHIQGELSEEGKNQAKNLGEKISKIFQFDEIFCSPINRAKQTLLEILPSQKTKNIKYYDLCKEINRGEFEGKPMKEVNEYIKNTSVQFRDFKTADSESYKNIYLRCQQFLEEIIQKYINKNYSFDKLPEDKDLVEEQYFEEKFNKGELTATEKLIVMILQKFCWFHIGDI
jgi:broad specificity phosphatase PhoE